MKHKKQKQAESQQTVKQTVDKTAQHYSNMLSSMLQANVDSSKRIAENKQAHEVKLLETKQQQDTRNLHAYKTKTDFRKSTVAKQSRRSIVISMLHAAQYTKTQIAQALVDKFDIADLSNNKKCVSGTMYDLQTNTTCNFKTDDSEVISCISANCKYKQV